MPVAAVLAALALSFIFNHKIILLTVQIIPIILVCGCLIAEGIFTIKATDKETSYKIEDYNHESGKKYIRESIKQLYEQGITNLREQNPDLKNQYIEPWNNIVAKFCSVDSSRRAFRYKTLWDKYPDKSQYGSFINWVNLYLEDGLIYACFNKEKAVVASTKFNFKYSITPKTKYCWYDSKTSMKCKSFKEDKQSGTSSYDLTEEYFYDEEIEDLKPLLTEKVENNYPEYELQYEEDYTIEDFPVAYHLMTYNDYLKELQKDDDELKFSFDDSTKHFKVKGKKWAKAYVNYYKKVQDEIQDSSFSIILKEPKSLEEASKQCDDYDEDSTIAHICDDYVNFEDIKDYLRSNYIDFNLGKEVPYIKSHYKKESLSDLNNQLKTSRSYIYLYNIALINLIIQIGGTLFWISATVLGLLCHSDDNSEKEVTE